MLTARPRPPEATWSLRGAGSGSGEPPAPSRHPGPGTSNWVATGALALLTLSSTVGLDRVFIGHSWILPVICCGVAAHLAGALFRRWRLPVVAAVPLSAVVVALVAVWTILGATTRYGLPDHLTWKTLTSDIDQTRQDFSGSVAPVVALPGFRLAAAAGAGLVAVLSDWIAFRRRAPLFATAPAFALFIVCCSSGEGPGRELTVLVEVAALMLFVLSISGSGGAGAPVWFAGVRAGMFWSGIRSAALTAGVAILAVALVTPSITREDGRGLLGWRSAFGTGPGGTRVVPDPTANLQTDIIKLGNVPVFVVTSPVSSYWRLTSLDTFDGSSWSSSGSYRGFGAQLPGTGARPADSVEIQEQFQIEQLASDWFPLAFNPLAVRGIQDVSYDPSSNSLLSSSQTSFGDTYTVTSYEYLSTLDQAELQAAPALTNLGSLKSELALPSSVSPRVYQLAQQIVAGKTTEYDKAVALQDYLRSSLFSYSLSPKYDGSGNNALETFLFDTRQGYCQQFAGSFAVMARAVGLPTRLAVGFATGNQAGTDTYQVVDGDAHTWPEVYFGPQFGWIPFEPTKGFSNPTASGVDGTSSSSPGVAVPVTPTSAPTTLPSAGGGGSSRLKIQKPTAAAPVTAALTASHGGGIAAGWWAVPAVVVAVAVWTALNLGIRRLRRRIRRNRAAGHGPPAEVLANWADVTELLAWRGVPRRASETFAEYAGRAGRRLDETGFTPLARSVGRLAQLADRAAYAAGLSPAAAGEAAEVATDIEERLYHGASRSERIRWWLLPRPGRTRTA